ncbi:MAG: hypothetical protein K6C12_10565 [Oscillospiraceae bacterium]|nr:hypothetical protein [Oscillospiraceae bacterium]
MSECRSAQDKAKEIIRIVIKGSSGYGPVEEAFEDKVVITRDSIRYEYTPYLASETNPVRKWSYKTTSPIFQKEFDTLALLMPKVMTMEGFFVKDVGAITFTITYSDKSRGEREFFLPGDDFKQVFSVIKTMVPGCEYVPAVLLTSEDYEENEIRGDN